MNKDFSKHFKSYSRQEDQISMREKIWAEAFAQHYGRLQSAYFLESLSIEDYLRRGESCAKFADDVIKAFDAFINRG